MTLNIKEWHPFHLQFYGLFANSQSKANVVLKLTTEAVNSISPLMHLIAKVHRLKGQFPQNEF